MRLLFGGERNRRKSVLVRSTNLQTLAGRGLDNSKSLGIAPGVQPSSDFSCRCIGNSEPLEEE